MSTDVTPNSLVWTTEKPTIPGWYWMQTPQKIPWIVNVREFIATSRHYGELGFSYNLWSPLHEIHSPMHTLDFGVQTIEFAGPIPEPVAL